MTGVDEPPDSPREIHERAGPLWLAAFLGGPLDGTVEVREGILARHVARRWYPMTKGGPVNVYLYTLIEPIEGGWVEYVLSDVQPQQPE